MSELCLPRKTWVSSLLISDLKQFCSFLLSQPLYLSYFVFFSPYLLKIISFLFPLVFTTSLLLLAFLTVSPGLIRKFLPHSKVGHLLSACHAVVEDGTQECFALEDFEAYKIVFEGPIMDVQESQSQFSEQSLVENSMEKEDKKLEDLIPKVESPTSNAPCTLAQQSIWEHHDNSVTQHAELNVGVPYTPTRQSIWKDIKQVAQQAELNVSVPYTPTEQHIWKDINQDNSVAQQTGLNTCPHKELVGELESMGSVKGEKKVEAEGANADKVVENQKARNGSEDEEANVNKTKPKPKTKTPITGNDSQSPKVESSRTLDYNLVSNGSMRKEKEWKRTLACKLYEERNTRDGSGEGMDLLWETYEMDAIKSKVDSKKKTKKRWESKRYNNKVDSEDEEEEVNDQLCCLQALKFSAGKVNLGMGIGKPNLMKISKAIKGFGWLHHVSSKHSKKVHIEDRL